MKLRIFIFALFLLAPLTPAQAEESKVTVFAASSLAQSFTEIGRQFQIKNPGIGVQFSFLSSATLATQILAGAPADIFASASETDMQRIKARAPISQNFISNHLVLVAPKQAKVPIRKLVDLNKSGVKWIQCAHSAPCGVVADKALSAFGKVTSRPSSYEENVAGVVAKIVAGEVDAGLVYHTDYLAHADIWREIRFGDTASTLTGYSIGALTDTKAPYATKKFLNFILSASGRAVLARAGFSRVN